MTQSETCDVSFNFTTRIINPLIKTFRKSIRCPIKFHKFNLKSYFDDNAALLKHPAEILSNTSANINKSDRISKFANTAFARAIRENKDSSTNGGQFAIPAVVFLSFHKFLCGFKYVIDAKVGC